MTVEISITYNKWEPVPFQFKIHRQAKYYHGPTGSARDFLSVSLRVLESPPGFSRVGEGRRAPPPVWNSLEKQAKTHTIAS